MPLQSREILSVGYEPVRKVLEVEYRSGGIYQYSPVQPLVYSELMNFGTNESYLDEALRNAGYVETKVG